MRDRYLFVLASVLALVPNQVAAEVTASGDAGFVSHSEILVRASPAEAWTVLVTPAEWWNGDHTYSGDPANMALVPEVGGCFCEAIPGEDGQPAGEIEHMRAIYVVPGSTLRLVGALGPLQSEAVTGVLTITLVLEGDMTRITWDYVVGGYMRQPIGEMAPLADRVVGEQLLRLAARLGVIMDPAARRF